MIISASRRTDIPAFYAEWFMNQIRNKEILRRNPYNNQILKNSLNPEDISCIVFWTRNAKPMIKNDYLKELDDLGIPYYFQYTITGYPKQFEKNTLHPFKAIDTINELSDLIGGNKIIWRFDPIFTSDIMPSAEIVRLHNKIASLLDKNINENVISFLDDYKKTYKNLKAAGVEASDLLNNPTELDFVLTELSNTANNYGLNISTCAENIDLSKYGISKGKCIDGDFIERELGIKVKKSKDQGQRKECGCIKSIDVGIYDTCVHGCEYCYATQSKSIALNNFKKHDPMNQFIIKDEKFNLNKRII